MQPDDATLDNQDLLDADRRGLELIGEVIQMGRSRGAAGGVSSLAGMRLQSLGELGWLNRQIPPPHLPRLMTATDGDGRTAPFLPLGKTAMLAAAGGTGKSQALVQLAVAIATGRPWLGCYDVVAPGHVALVLAEEDRDEVWRRVFWAAQAMDLWSDPEAMELVATRVVPVPLYGRDTRMIDDNGRHTPFTADLVRMLDGHGVDWRLVVLDPARRFNAAEGEKDSAAATEWIQVLEQMTKVRGTPTVLFAHHTNKISNAGDNTDQGAARGTSALTDGVRWQANLERIKGKPHRCLLRLVKSNYGPIPEPLELSRDLDHGGYLVRAPDEPEKTSAALETVADLVVAHLREAAGQAQADGRPVQPRTREEIRKAIRKQAQAVAEALRKLQLEGIVRNHGARGWSLQA